MLHALTQLTKDVMPNNKLLIMECNTYTHPHNTFTYNYLTLKRQTDTPTSVLPTGHSQYNQKLCFHDNL